MLARLICALTFAFALLPAIAAADCLPKDWDQVTQWREWLSHTPPENARNWQAEALRIGNKDRVWRYLDRLHLGLDSGKVVTLVDCPFGDELTLHLYERFDEAGGFHVVRILHYEDHQVALIPTRTGKTVTIPGLPIWSPDRAHFAYGVCDLMNAKDDVAIMSVAPDGLRTETAGHLPCGAGDCRLLWEGPGMLSATCENAGQQGNERKVMRFVRRGDQWQSTTGSR